MDILLIVVAIAAVAVGVRGLQTGRAEAEAQEANSPTPTPTPAFPSFSDFFRPPDSIDVPNPTAESIGPAFAAAPSLAQSLIMANWPPEDWENAAMVGSCESGWRADAWNRGGTGGYPVGHEDSRGWFQINVNPNANSDLAWMDLFDPVVNVQAAMIIWRRQGWQAWSCAQIHGIT